MSGKMTDEKLEQSRRVAAIGGAWIPTNLLDHIAALEAEQDRLRVEAKGHRLDAEAMSRVIRDVRSVLGLTDDSRHEPGVVEATSTLRDRVTALEEQNAHNIRMLDESEAKLEALGKVNATLLGQVQALTTEVQALNREKEEWRQSRFVAARERHDVESQLAAVRQRAGGAVEPFRRQVVAAIKEEASLWHHSADAKRALRGARVRITCMPVVLGTEASPSDPLHCCGTTTEVHPPTSPTIEALRPLGTAPPSEMDGMQGEMVEPVKGPHKLGTNSEPTTTPPVEELRACMAHLADYEWHNDNEVDPLAGRGTAALSTLERRMGALVREVEQVRHPPIENDGSDYARGYGDGWTKRGAVLRGAVAALTGASEVYEREDAARAEEAAYRSVFEIYGDAQRAKQVADAVAAALRRSAP